MDGAPITSCREAGCPNPGPFVRAWCSKHYTRWRRTGDPEGITIPHHPGGPGHHAWSGAQCSYRAAHDRKRKADGRAADHACVECGDPAQTWAYDHNDPDELFEGSSPYSADPAHYQPMCVPCHRAEDLLVTLAREEVLTGGSA